MARVTVEDCEKVVKNRFNLVLLAAQRAKEIKSGEPITVDNTKEEKNPVIALREIAAQTISVPTLKDEVVKSFRTFLPQEEVEEDPDDFLEEDTYNPYTDLEMKAIESDQSVTISDEENSIDSDDESEEDSEIDDDIIEEDLTDTENDIQDNE